MTHMTRMDFRINYYPKRVFHFRNNPSVFNQLDTEIHDLYLDTQRQYHNTYSKYTLKQMI